MLIVGNSLTTSQENKNRETALGKKSVLKDHKIIHQMCAAECFNIEKKLSHFAWYNEIIDWVHEATTDTS